MAPTREQFDKWVHSAFSNLYDSAELRKSPLTELLGIVSADATERAVNLRKSLLDIIRNLRPGTGVPSDSADWRGYRILKLRYIEGQSPSEAMQELALGRSQFFHEQARILEMAASILWEQVIESMTPPTPPADSENREALVQSETQRLSAQTDWKDLDMVEVLSDLQPLIASLASQQGVDTTVETIKPGLRVRADRVLLRQAILGAVSAVLERSDVDTLELIVLAEKGCCSLCCQCRLRAFPPRQDTDPGLSETEQLLEIMGGHLQEEQPEPDVWRVYLSWPQARLRTLLVIDDNHELAELFRRYLVRTGWVVASAADGDQARKMIVCERPSVVALDIMLPTEDGWELLAAFKADPATKDIPIVVCSVLAQPRIALSLGADAFMGKPVSQDTLVTLLQRWQ